MSIILKCDCGCGNTVNPGQSLLYNSAVHALRGVRREAKRAKTSRSHLCSKGDVWVGAANGFEILRERSSTENGATVLLWEDSPGRLGVWVHSGRLSTVSGYADYVDERQSYKVYEDVCKNYGCTPYPRGKDL